MDTSNLPGQRFTFGIGRTLGQAWSNAQNSAARVGGIFGRGTPVNQSFDVGASLDTAHEQLHSRMAARAVESLRSGKTVQSARLSPDPRYDIPPMDNSGMTRVGQHTTPIYGIGDVTRPAAAAITFNPWERDKGSITYMAQPGTGIHTAVPES